MHLMDQVTQPSEQEYRKCPVCEGPMKRYKPSRQRDYCSRKCASLRNVVPNPEPTEDEIRNNIRRIALSQGQCAVVDADIFDFLNQWHWHAVWKHKTRSFVAVRNSEGKGRVTVYMARVIMNAPDGTIVDHARHDTLDNRRQFLRVVNNEQNTRNSRKHVATSSRFKGVSRHRDRWEVYIRINGKKTYLGSSDSEEKAAEMYREAARKHYGEFACVESLVPESDTIENVERLDSVEDETVVT